MDWTSLSSRARCSIAFIAVLLACVSLAAASANGAAAERTTAAAPGGFTEAWSAQRNPEAPAEGGPPILAGPVAYSPRVGEPPRFFAMALAQRLVLSDASGREVWALPLEGDAQQTIAVADIDRDGRSELLLSLEDAVACARDDGRLAWRRPIDGVMGCPVAADLVGDARLEVVAGDGNGGVTCLDAAGRVLWHLLAENARRPVDKDPFVSRLNWNFERYANRDVTSSLAVGDVDRDGQQEVIVATEPGFVYCVSGLGEWKWQFCAGGQCFGAPVIADLDGDGPVEVVVGSDDRHLYILRGDTGAVRAACPTQWGVTPSIAVADLDRDGASEIAFGDAAGFLYCCDAQGGERWRLPLKDPRKTSDYGDRMVAPPAIADVDGDGELELVVGIRGRECLYVVGADGKIEAAYQLESGRAQQLAESGVQDTPVVADLEGHGQLQVLAATKLFSTRLFRTSGNAMRVAWAGARGTPALTGCVLASCGGATKRGLSRERALEQGTIALSSEASSLVDGIVNADVRRPSNVPAVLLTAVRTTSGVPELRIDQVLTPQDQFGLAIPADNDWPTAVRCVEVTAGDGHVLAEASTRIRMSAAAARQRVHEGALALADAAIQKLRLDWPNNVALAAARAAGIEGLTSATPSPADWAKRDVKVAAQLRALPDIADRQRAGGGPTWLVAWTANPWDPFEPGTAWPEDTANQAVVETSLYRGEYESATIDLLNLSALPLQVRLAVSDLKPEGETPQPAPPHISLRQTTMVPRPAGDQVGDALVALDEPGVITISPMQAAQLWVTINGDQASEGLYKGAITLTEMRPKGKTATVPVQVNVLPIALPEKSPVRFCTWAYLENSAFANQIDAAMADLIAHGNNVFTLSAGITVRFGDAGQVTPPEWTQFDVQLSRYVGHGLILILEPNLQFSGQGEPSQDIYAKAHAEAIRLLARHMSDKGLTYSDWAMYVVDEPGLEHGPRIEYLVEHGRRIKAADPQIQNYTDPIVVMGLDDLERAAPYVDIWCPEQDSLYRIWGPTADMHAEERLAVMRADSSQVWTYECFPRVKRISPLGYYRHQAWLAWKLGLNGLGFWTYCTGQEDPWTPSKDEYLLVYPGRDGPIPSKRWEACRDGVEDYQALWLATQAADAAASRGASSAQAARAELGQLVDTIIHERAAWQALRAARRRIAEITLTFQSAAPSAVP